MQDCTVSPATVDSQPGSPTGAASGYLATELSFAAFAKQQKPHQQEQYQQNGQASNSRAPCHDAAGSPSQKGIVGEGEDEQETDAASVEDQVLYDAEEASYISDTDYTGLAGLAAEVSRLRQVAPSMPASIRRREYG